jgi:hypothetical protein
MRRKFLRFIVAVLTISSAVALGHQYPVFAEDAISPSIASSVQNSFSKKSLDLTLKMCYDGPNPPATNGYLHHFAHPTAYEIGSGDWFDYGSSMTTSYDLITRKYALQWTVDKDLVCSSFNSPGNGDRAVGLLSGVVSSTFGWTSLTEGACKLGMVRTDNSDCINSTADFKRGDAGYKFQVADSNPGLETPAGKYAQGAMLCGDGGSFIKYDTAGPDANATLGESRVVYLVVVNDDKKHSVVKSYLKSVTGSTYADMFGLESCVAAMSKTNADAYNQWLQYNPDGLNDITSTQNTQKDSGDTQAACTGGSLGWVLCPVATLMQDLIKWVADIIGSLMETKPIAGNASLQNVWGTFVGFANLLLVIAFLIVIFSQATSIGLSAYGIKKMLPKIIAGAILINLSYFICAFMLDIANILGGSIKGVVNAVPVDTGSTVTAGSSWAADITSLALAGVGVYMLATGYVSFIVPVLITGALAVVSILLIIALRQVVVILLVLVSPLAFAAMILPNTESLFTKWRKLFINMLIMYPVVMFLLYGSELVGKLIQVTATDDSATTMLTKMVAFIVMTFGPFAGLYMYLKNSNKLMSMATGGVSKLGSGFKKWGDDWAGRKKDNSYVQQRRKANIEASSTAKRQRNLYKMDSKGAPWYMKSDAQQILNTQTNEAVEKIHGQRVAFAKQEVSKKYNASDAGHRAQMAQAAIAAAKRGDQVQLDALMSHAATIGPDEFKDVYDKVQTGIDVKGSEGKILGNSNRFIYATHGAELGQKNRGLMTMLQTGNPETEIRLSLIHI